MSSLTYPSAWSNARPSRPLRWTLLTTGLLVFAALAGRAAEPRVIKVQPPETAASFDGWGTSLCWFANAIGRWPDPPRNAIADALFSPAGLGLTFVRYNIGGGEDPSHRHMPWFRQMEGFSPAVGEWNWAADPGQRWMLTAALRRGVNRVEAFSNAPPYWMTLSGCVSGAADPNHDNLDPRHEVAFAEYLAAVVKKFHQEWDVRFATIDPMNEPFTDYWRAHGKQEGCHFERASQARLIQRLRAALDVRGLQQVRISAADETNYSRAIETWQAYDAATRERVAVINAHAYDTARRTELRDLARQSGRPLVMSEVDGGGGNPHDHRAIGPALILAKQIIDDLRDLQPERWTFWQAVEDETGMKDANSNWGLIHADLLGETRAWEATKKFHAMAQFTRFIHPGATWATLSDTASVAMHDRTRSTLVVVACNTGRANEVVTFDVSPFGAVGSRVEVFRTSATEDCAALGGTETAADGLLAASLAAESITTFVVHLGAGTPRP
ncbi:MAG: glycoside hydrolase [Opitutaceae bacterium]